MPILRNIRTLATCRIDGDQAQIHSIQDAAVAWEGSRISWVGPENQLPPHYESLDQWDAGGRLVIPGLVDCHTHLAFGGWRADEFAQRIQGRSYGDIAQSGGGIVRTVEQTRACSYENLLQRCLGYLNEMAQLGVTTVECKSGYGLTVESETKLLNVYKALDEQHPVKIVPTFLGAHVVPAEYSEHRHEYIDLLQNELIPMIAKHRLARFCDAFVDDSAFTIAEARAVLETGKQYGLRPKLHADQLTNGDAAQLAAELGAVSADHLEYASQEGIQKLAEAGVIAVSLPLASLYLNQQPICARTFIDAKVPVAVATDFNPGTAPSFDLPLAMMLACTMQRMTPAEVLKGSTVYAAKALGLADTIGSIEPGKSADLTIIDAPDVDHWMYHFRPNACVATIIQGTPCIDHIGMEH